MMLPWQVSGSNDRLQAGGRYKYWDSNPDRDKLNFSVDYFFKQFYKWRHRRIPRTKHWRHHKEHPCPAMTHNRYMSRDQLWCHQKEYPNPEMTSRQEISLGDVIMRRHPEGHPQRRICHHDHDDVAGLVSSCLLKSLTSDHFKKRTTEFFLTFLWKVSSYCCLNLNLHCVGLTVFWLYPLPKPQFPNPIRLGKWLVTS